MSPFSHAAFLAAVGPSAPLPEEGPAEIAFAGRSNVGKSSAINALAARRRLAFASKTPGRTQTLNFFDLGGAARLVDLPGYGFAKVPAQVRAQWRELVGAYFAARGPRVALVLVMDARHPLTPLDLQLIDWLGLEGRRALVLLTKADKLSRRGRDEALQRLRRRCPGIPALLFSSHSGEGVAAARALLEGWISRAANKKPPVKGI